MNALIKVLPLVAVVVFFASIAFSQLANDSISIEENERLVLRLNRGEKQNLRYHVLPSNFLQVRVFFQPIDKRKALDELSVYFSTKSTEPSDKDYERQCVPKRYESCDFLLDRSAGEEEKTLITMGVFCVDLESCEFDVTVLHGEAMTLEPDFAREFVYKRQEIETFNISIPKKEEFERVVLTAHLKSGYLSATNSDFHPQMIFNTHTPLYRELSDRLIAYFDHGSLDCFKCNITVSVLAPIGTAFEIVLRLYNITSRVSLDSEYVDYYRKGEINIYELELDKPMAAGEPDLRIFFAIDSLTGSGKYVYVNPDSLPEDPRKALWISKPGDDHYNEEEDIIISQWEIQSKHILGKSFFIAVASENSGLYVIKARLKKEKVIPLHMGIMDFDSLGKDEVQNYELDIYEDLNETESQSNLLHVTAQAEEGSVNIYARVCEEKDNNCPPIDWELIQESKKKKVFEYFDEVHGKQNLLISPKCPASRSRHCLLQIGVVGVSNSTATNKYSLLAKRDNMIVNLLENKVLEEHISEDSVQFFKFYLEDKDNDVIRIRASINADLEFQGVKHEFCFLRADVCNTSDLLIGSKGKPLIWKKNMYSNNLGDFYYFMVKGAKTTSYQIFLEVNRTTHAAPVIMKIFEGKMAQGYLSVDAPRAYFKFQAEFNLRTDIEIFLQGDIGRYRMYVSNDNATLPSEGKFAWKSHNNYLRIPKGGENYFPRSSVYYVLVVPEKNEDLHFKSLSFSIMFATPSTVRLIENNEVFYDNMNGNETREYFFLVTPEKSSIFIVIDVLSPQHTERDFSIKVFGDKEIPVSKGKDKSSFQVSTRDLLSYCNTDSSLCPLLLKVINDGSSHTSYSFSVRAFMKEFALRVRDGVEQEFPFGEQVKSLNLFIEPIAFNNGVDFLLYTYNLNFKLLISISKNEGNKTLVKFPEPGATSHFQYTLPVSSKSHFVLKPDSFKTCRPHCVIFMTAEIIPDENITSSELGTDQTLQVLVTSEMAIIYPDHPVIFSAALKEWKYFSLPVRNLSETHVIALTRLSGEVVGVVNIIDDSSESSRPTLDSFDLVIHYDYLALPPEFIAGIIEKKHMKGKNISIIVGAQGMAHQESQYQISSYIESLPVLRIIVGFSQDVTLNDKQALFFDFSNFREEDFKIMFDRTSGLGVLSVTNCKPGRPLSSCMEDVDIEAKITGASSTIVRIEKTSKTFCVGCTYIIKLRGTGILSGSLSVVYTNVNLELEDGRVIHDSARANEYNKYVFSANSSSPIEISVTVMSGSPFFYLNFVSVGSFEQYRLNYSLSSSENSGKAVFSIPARDSSEFHTLFPGLNLYQSSSGNYTRNPKIYIGIEAGHTDSNYSIMCRTKGAQISLKPGAFFFGTIKAGDTWSYIFRKSSSDPKLTIAFNLQNGTNENIGARLYYRDDTDTMLALNQSFKEMQDYKFQISSAAMLIDLTNEKVGAYLLSLWRWADAVGSYTPPTEFSIVMNTQGTAVLPFKAEILNFLKPFENQYYETYIPRPGVLAVAVYECTGSVALTLTDKYNLLEAGLSDLKLKQSAGSSYINTISVHKGVVYLSLKTDLQPSYFKLSTQLFSSYEEIPALRVAAREKNTVVWTFDSESGQFLLEFDPVVCKNCQEEELARGNVTYDLILTTNKTLVGGLVKCGIFHDNGLLQSDHNLILGVSLTLKQSSESKTKIKLGTPSLPLGTTHYAGIQAQVVGLKHSEGQTITVEYETVELFAAPSVQSGLSLILIFAIVVLFIVFMVGCLFYFRRFKKVQKQLRYEMQEIKAAVNFSGTNVSVSDDTQQSIENKRVYVGIEEN